MLDFSQLIETGKTIGKIVGVGFACVGAYTTAGGPWPVTVDRLNQEVARINSSMNSSIQGLTLIVLEGQLEQHETQKAVLRSEKYNLEISKGANPGSRQSLDAVTDKLNQIDANDRDLRVRIDALKNPQK